MSWISWWRGIRRLHGEAQSRNGSLSNTACRICGSPSPLATTRGEEFRYLTTWGTSMTSSSIKIHKRSPGSCRSTWSTLSYSRIASLISEFGQWWRRISGFSFTSTVTWGLALPSTISETRMCRRISPTNACRLRGRAMHSTKRAILWTMMTYRSILTRISHSIISVCRRPLCQEWKT